MDGIFLINKPKGCTSFDVVYKVKKKLNTKKVGHTGTLDPDTTGLLVICVNRATKFIPIITDNSKKQYIAKMKLGIKTDTGDIGGIITKTQNVNCLNEDIKSSFNKFEKTYDQIPPKYSAKKVNGKKAYELARKNKDFELSAKKVTVYKNDIINIDDEIEFVTTVSKGTYVRSLIEDIAADLNTIGTMTSLSRVYTDGFSLNDAIEVDEVSYDKIINLKSYCLEKYQCIIPKDIRAVSNGVHQDILKDKTYPLLYVDNDNNPIALYDIKEDKAKVAFMFNAGN